MPSALWYCQNIGNSVWPFVLLALPLGGAYFYGQNQKRRAWILIGVWAVVQTVISALTNMNCVD